MNNKIILLIIIAMIFAVSCKKEKDNIDVKPINLSAKQQKILESGNEFAIDLLKRTNEIEQGNNFLISPLSVNYALAITMNGAKNNTLSQMLTSMNSDQYNLEELNVYYNFLMNELLNLDDLVDLSIANSIWYNKHFNVLPEFLSVNQQYYNAEVSSLDFSQSSAVNTINNWVANNTGNKITEIIDVIPPDAVMYLINAIYFYGQWKFEFDKSKTKQDAFYLSNNETVDVEMMKMEAQIKHFQNGEMTMIELPYGRGNFVMNITMPTGNGSIGDYLSQLNTDNFGNYLSSMTNKDIVLTMPKFSFEYKTELQGILSQMGMTDLFIEGIADLSGINGIGGLFVSRVLHKTYIDVNEEGTEAAAVTAVEITFTSAPAEDVPLFVNINKPFVFTIRETSTGAILFSGVVNDPSK